MEKNDAIRRAVRQSPAPELPTGFTPRLMARMQHEAARRARLETCLLGTGGLGCFAVLIAACGRFLCPDFKQLFSDFALPRFEWRVFGLHFELPRFELPEGSESLTELCAGIALIAIVLLLADLVIRHRFAASRN